MTFYIVVAVALLWIAWLWWKCIAQPAKVLRRGEQDGDWGYRSEQFWK
jgi:hypothetical protein